MRRRQVAITLVSACVLGMAGALYVGCHSEPSSHGYSLGQLLVTYDAIYHGYLTTPGWQDTRQYVREIGTRGLPQMLRWLGEERPQWKVKAFDLHEKFPPVLRTKLVHNWLSGEREELHTRVAAYGFEILGPMAIPALPELERMASDSKHPNRSGRAIAVLKSMGRDAVPAFVRIVIAPISTNRFQVFEILGSMGTNAAPAVPILTELIKNKDVDIAASALKTLDKLQLSGATVVPAIAEIVDHPRLHYLAISTLADYGAEARPAIPRLIQCLTNIDHDIAITAARALARLGLEADSVVPALVNCLKTRDPELRQAAITALKQYLSPGSDTATTQNEELGGLRRGWLAQSTPGTEVLVKGSSVSYYRPGNWDTEPSLPFIIKSLQHSGPQIQREAIAALGPHGRENPEAALALIDCLDDHPFEIAVAAAQSLSESRLQPGLVLPFLIEWLAVPRLRLHGIVCLAEYGDYARAAEPALRKYLGGPEDKIIRAALGVIDSGESERTIARP